MRSTRHRILILLLVILPAILLIVLLTTKISSTPSTSTNNLTLPPQSSKTQVWFTPNTGSVDMLDLFNKPEQWAAARSKIDVFKFYTGQVGTGGWSCTTNKSSNCGPNHLENLVKVNAFAKLNQWGIDIAIESFFTGPVASVNPVECTTSQRILALALDGSVNVIQSVQQNGGTVRYLAMDEPVRQWYPTRYYLDTGQTDPRPCLTDSLDTLADQVAAYIHQINNLYPSVLIGQIELYPEVGVDQLKEWVIALEHKNVSLQFLHVDVHGPRVDQYIALGLDINLVADLKELDSFLEEHGIEFGLIYTDIYWDSQAWEENQYNNRIYYDKTMNWVNTIKTANIMPDQSIFQSWIFPLYTTGIGPNQLPINLPEDNHLIYSHTRLINDALNIITADFPETSTNPESKN